MLNRERLWLAIEIQRRSYALLRWIGKAIEDGKISVDRAVQHSDTPDAAYDWIQRTLLVLPAEVRPDPSHIREFSNFFWTYVTTSFDVLLNPGTILVSDADGCLCPLCARIANAPHLRAKKLTKADKLRADELMTERVVAVAKEEGFAAGAEQADNILRDVISRRLAAFSAYGQSLINRLTGETDGPAILALWREIAWTRAGSPIQGFSLRIEDFESAENDLVSALHKSLKETDREPRRASRPASDFGND